jgi:hypothetical protein
MEVSGQLHAPAASPRGKSHQYPLERKVGEPQSGSEWCGEKSWPYRDSNSNPSAIQPETSRCTDYKNSQYL